MPFRDGITVFSQNTPYVCRAYPPDAPPPNVGDIITAVGSGAIIGEVIGAQIYSKTKKETAYRIFLRPSNGYKETVSSAAMDSAVNITPGKKEYLCTCKYCGEPFKSFKRSAMYCSMACTHKARRRPLEKRTCPVCGKVFEVRQGRKKRCCSVKCTGISNSNEWKTKQEEKKHE